MITKIGLGTFVDPRLEGGKMNKATTQDLVKVISLQGEEWLLYPAFPVDVAIIRGTTADEDGNLTVEDEGALLECLPLAQAARNSGGIVIAQVENLAKRGTLHPKAVRVPGVLVDYVLLAKPENHWQSAGTYFNPAFSGDLKVPLSSIPEWPLDERLVICRRAAMELTPGSIVNLGIGIPDGVAIVASLEGASDLLTLTTELGAIGGVPAGGENFGMSFNAQAFVEQQAQFDWYDGGGLDQAFLGAAEVDQHGNVNVSKFKGRCVGCGGFINITQNAKKVVYCGTFTAGGLKVKVADGSLAIVQEGKGKKYVKEVEQVTFSGAYATQTRQPVLYITERCVFELRDGRADPHRDRAGDGPGAGHPRPDGIPSGRRPGPQADAGRDLPRQVGRPAPDHRKQEGPGGRSRPGSRTRPRLEERWIQHEHPHRRTEADPGGRRSVRREGRHPVRRQVRQDRRIPSLPAGRGAREQDLRHGRAQGIRRAGLRRPDPGRWCWKTGATAAPAWAPPSRPAS